jgi:hypothetical protein
MIEQLTFLTVGMIIGAAGGYLSSVFLSKSFVELKLSQADKVIEAYQKKIEELSDEYIELTKSNKIKETSRYEIPISFMHNKEAANYSYPLIISKAVQKSIQSLVNEKADQYDNSEIHLHFYDSGKLKESQVIIHTKGKDVGEILYQVFNKDYSTGWLTSNCSIVVVIYGYVNRGPIDIVSANDDLNKLIYHKKDEDKKIKSPKKKGQKGQHTHATH